MGTDTPWHVPDKWYAAPAFWEPEFRNQFADTPKAVRLVDSTLAEGPDAVGCQLGWKGRIDLALMLIDIGMRAITFPGGCSTREAKDWLKAVKQNNSNVLILNKLSHIGYPHRPDWKERIDRQTDLGGDVYLAYSKWNWGTMISDFAGVPSKAQVIDCIQEGVHYMKSKGLHVNFSSGDTFRHHVPTLIDFYRAALEAGADSFYLWDSRGNSNPFVSYYLVKKIKELVAGKPIYVQFHNDLGMATGNCFATAMAGATMLDCAALGIGDRGGCVPLEEIACSLEAYGIDTGIKLEKLTELAKLTEKAFHVEPQLWKPIVGRGAFMENGWGHRASDDPGETACGISPKAVGTHFQSMLGGRAFSDKERDEEFWVDVLTHWGYTFSAADLAEIKVRTMHSIISQRGAIDLDEFQLICESVLGGTG